MRKKSYSVYHNDRESWINITIPNVIGEKLFDAVQEQLAENLFLIEHKKIFDINNSPLCYQQH